MATVINLPIIYVPDPERGRPLFNAQVFVGEPDLDPQLPANQKQLYVIQEDGTQVAVSQPFTLSSGGVPAYQNSTVRLAADGNYSIKILDRDGAQKYYVHNVLEDEPVTIVDGGEYFVRNFATLDDAVSSTLLQNGDACNIAERTTNNGGGGMWDVVLASTVSPNAFDIVQCTGVPTLALVLRIAEEVTVKQLGAVGDGVTNDTSEIQRAFALADGKSLYIESGVYLCSSTITLSTSTGIRVRGDTNMSNLRFTHAGDGVSITKSTGNADGNIDIYGLVLSTTNASSGTALKIVGAYNGSTELRALGATLREVAAIGGVAGDDSISWENGFHLTSVASSGSDRLYARGRVISGEDLVGFGIRVDGDSTEGIKLTRSEILRFGTGLLCDNTVGTTAGVEGTGISQCTFLACTNGISLNFAPGGGDPGNYIRDSHISAIKRCIIARKANQMTISDMLLYGRQENDTTPFVAIDIDDGVAVTIHSNQFNLKQGTTEATCISVDNVNYLNVYGNMLQGVQADYGGKIGSGCENVRWENNNFTNAAIQDLVNNLPVGDNIVKHSRAGGYIQGQFNVTNLVNATDTALNIDATSIVSTLPSVQITTNNTIVLPKGVSAIRVVANVSIEANTSGRRHLTARVGASPISGGGALEAPTQQEDCEIGVSSGIYQVDPTGGDTLTFNARQDSGVGLDTVASVSLSSFYIELVY